MHQLFSHFKLSFLFLNDKVGLWLCWPTPRSTIESVFGPTVRTLLRNNIYVNKVVFTPAVETQEKLMPIS